MLSGDQDVELAREQEYVDSLFERLDGEVAAAQERLREVSLHTDPTNPSAEALVQRETEYHGLNRKIDRLNIAQLGLVFGRIDVTDKPENIENPVPGAPDQDRRYIGRMGLDDRTDGYRTLLLDWRAPLARPFYLATTAHPEGVYTRRHLRMHGRTVTAYDDEHLSGPAPASRERGGVGSESALLAALEAARTGHMRDIVETIQREQDQVIRAATKGVLVVEGGPGTGKTAVALHRVAYLLYTWREQLARTGVLIVGPNRTFLDYISRVLPELGETGVVLSTIGDLYPGVRATAPESLLTREVKGSAEMVHILKAAVQAHEVLPATPVEVLVGSITLEVTPAMVKAARTRARRARRPHNDARPLFREHLVGQLAAHMASRIGADPLGGANLLSRADVDALHDELLEEPDVGKLVDDFWPETSPEEVLRWLLEDPEHVALAATDYDDETHEALLRAPGSPWAASDAALLDELAELIGVPGPEESRAAAEEAWRQELRDAQDALDILAGSENTDNTDEDFEAEYLSAHDVIDAATLARRQQVRDVRTTAERAQEDHRWSFGHVIVDEAQELSPMEWRMVMRRSPTRWMTLVGDTAQTGSPAGVDAWNETLEPFVGSRFTVAELTVNYRTPREIMEVANEVLAEFAPDATPARTIRVANRDVRFLPAGSDPTAVAAVLQAEDDERLVQVIDAGNVSQIKGLEFDHVVVVDPGAIVEASPQGWQDLYVALTRATLSLTIIGELPLG